MSAQTTPTQALAKKEPTETDIMKGWVNRSAGAFKKILPKHLTAERFVKVAHAAITKEPKLAKCDPRSLIVALIHCAELGLEPNSPQKHVHLIPYRNKKNKNFEFEVQMQIGYQGLLHLAMQSGQLASVNVQIVCENDDFRLEFGDEPKIHHAIDIRKARGEIIGAYMVAKLKDGSYQREVMSIEQIEKIRDEYAAPDSPAWENNFGEMARKTVFKRGSKWLPQATEKDVAARAAALDTALDAGEDTSKMIDVEVLSELPPAAEEEPAAEMTQAERLKMSAGAAPAVVVEHAQPEPVKQRRRAVTSATTQQQAQPTAEKEHAKTETPKEPQPASNEVEKQEAPRPSPLETAMLAEIAAFKHLDDGPSWQGDISPRWQKLIDGPDGEEAKKRVLAAFRTKMGELEGQAQP